MDAPFFPENIRGQRKRAIICCMTLLLYAGCTGSSSSIVPRIHHSTTCEAALLHDRGCSSCHVTLGPCFSHTQHYDFFLSSRLLYAFIWLLQTKVLIKLKAILCRKSSEGTEVMPSCGLLGRAKSLIQQLCGTVYFKLTMYVYT